MFILSPLFAKDPVHQHLELGSAEPISIHMVSATFTHMSELRYYGDDWGNWISLHMSLTLLALLC